MNFHISYEMLTSEDFNKKLKYLKDNEYIIKYFSYEDAVEMGYKIQFNTAFLKINFINISLTYKDLEGKWKNYKHNLSTLSDKEEDLIDETDPSVAYAVFNRYCHIEDLSPYFGYCLIDNKVSWSISNFGGLRYINTKKINKRYENVYGYDMNGAFLSACIDLEIPSTFVGFNKIPEDDEIGFTMSGEPVYEKEECYYVFKKYINKGLNRWARNMYKNKKNAKTPREKQKYKDYGTYAIGCLARHNPFVRNCIICKSNKVMESLIDENTLLCNTDSIVSLVERKDLKLSDELGEFKIEHTGNFALTATGYQWNYGLPTICGFTKEKATMFENMIGRKYDILIDDQLDDMFVPRCFDFIETKIKERNVNQQFINFMRRYYGKHKN